MSRIQHAADGAGTRRGHRGQTLVEAGIVILVTGLLAGGLLAMTGRAYTAGAVREAGPRGSEAREAASTPPRPLPAGHATAAPVKVRRAAVIEHESPTTIVSIAFSPDGTVLAGEGASGDILLWSLATGATLARLAPRYGRTPRRLVGFAEDGALILHGDHEGQEAVRTARWTPRTRVVTSHSGVGGTAMSHDGSLFATLTGEGVTLFAAPAGTGFEVPSLPRSGTDSVAFAPGSTLMAAGHSNGSITLFDTGTLAMRGRLRVVDVPDDQPDTTNQVLALSFSAGGKALASLTMNGSEEITLWNLSTGRRMAVWPHRAGRWGRHLALAPDGRRLAVSCDHGELLLLDPRDPTAVSELHAPAAQGQIVMGFSPDGSVVVTRDQGAGNSLWSFAIGGHP